MLVRNLDFLSIPKEFAKVEVNIYEDDSIALVYIENKGYSLVLKNKESVVLILLKLFLNSFNKSSFKHNNLGISA